MANSFIISAAAVADAPGIVDLVNSAYRGDTSKQGWTTEADLLDGVRIDKESVLEIINHKESTLLLCRNQQHELMGCVHLKKQAQQMYLGMLTVCPRLQGAGIGKELLHCSEIFSRKSGAIAIVMNVISVRYELISWYERRGYKRTDETRAFPSLDPRFGIPKQPLEFIVLKKTL